MSVNTNERINKLLGFYKLQDLSLPTIRWSRFTGNEFFDPKYLWTIRTAIYKGVDINLPRYVGITAEEAQSKARKLLDFIGESGIVIYYRFFVAEKSGTLDIHRDFTAIEAVREDLWNLVTYSKKDTTIIIKGNEFSYHGNEDFLTADELRELLKYERKIKLSMRDLTLCDNSILLEWSFAYDCDVLGNKTGNRYLVFYEMRSVAT